MASRASYRKILVPVDGSRTSTAGLREALRVAEERSRVRVIHVLDETQARAAEPIAVASSPKVFRAIEKAGIDALDDAEALARKSDVRVETELLRSAGRRTADVILRDANRWGAELIAMGTHGRRGVSRLLLGSEAEAVLRGSRVPVLLVRGSSAKTRERSTTAGARGKRR